VSNNLHPIPVNDVVFPCCMICDGGLVPLFICGFLCKSQHLLTPLLLFVLTYADTSIWIIKVRNSISFVVLSACLFPHCFESTDLWPWSLVCVWELPWLAGDWNWRSQVRVRVYMRSVWPWSLIEGSFLVYAYFYIYLVVGLWFLLTDILKLFSHDVALGPV